MTSFGAEVTKLRLACRSSSCQAIIRVYFEQPLIPCSPCLKLKPNTKSKKAGYLMVNVEPYGGGLWHTWFDRDLSVAGTVIVRQGEKLKNLLVGKPVVSCHTDVLSIPCYRALQCFLQVEPVLPYWNYKDECSSQSGPGRAIKAAMQLSKSQKFCSNPPRAQNWGPQCRSECRAQSCEYQCWPFI